MRVTALHFTEPDRAGPGTDGWCYAVPTLRYCCAFVVQTFDTFQRDHPSLGGTILTVLLYFFNLLFFSCLAPSTHFFFCTGFLELDDGVWH